MKQRKEKRTHQRQKESELRGVSLPDDLYHISSQLPPLPIKTNLHSGKTTESCKCMSALQNMHLSLPTRESTKPNRSKSGNALNFAFLLTTWVGKASKYEEASNRRNITCLYEHNLHFILSSDKAGKKIWTQNRSRFKLWLHHLIVLWPLASCYCHWSTISLSINKDTLWGTNNASLAGMW